jgi:hypothetical protein
LKEYLGMSNAVAWALFALGIAHIAFGLVKFKAPLAEAASAGFVGQFMAPELRRTAFWFVILGPLVMLAGHAAVHAVEVGDLALLRIVGIYGFFTSVVGVVAVPKSPFWAVLVVSGLLLAAGCGFLP